MLCFVLINSVILNLLCVRVSLSLNLKKRTRSKNGPKAKTREKTWFMFHFELNVDFFYRLAPVAKWLVLQIGDQRVLVSILSNREASQPLSTAARPTERLEPHV